MNTPTGNRENLLTLALRATAALSEFRTEAHQFNDNRCWVNDPNGIGSPLEGEAARQLAADWRAVERSMGVAALDAFLQWEACQLHRFHRPQPSSPLAWQAREQLAGPDAIRVDALIRDDLLAVCEAFVPPTASEAEMAVVACGVWWRRRFSDILCAGATGFAAEPSLIDAPYPRTIHIPDTMWTLAAEPPSHDRSRFNPSVYSPMIASVIYAERVYPPPSEYLRLARKHDHVERVSSSVHRQFKKALKPSDFQPLWLRSALLGGLLDAAGERPALVALLWATDVGLLDDIWPAVEEEVGKLAEWNSRPISEFFGPVR